MQPEPQKNNRLFQCVGTAGTASILVIRKGKLGLLHADAFKCSSRFSCDEENGENSYLHMEILYCSNVT